MTLDDKPNAEGWKFREVDSTTFSLFINRELWFSSPKNFNDPFDCQIDIKGTFKEIESYLSVNWPQELESFKQGLATHMNNVSYGYFCLCREWKNTLMWSHYAKNHTGISLGFTFDEKSRIKTTELEKKEVVYGADALKTSIKRLNASFNMMRGFPVQTPGLMPGEAQGFIKTFQQNWLEFYEIVRFMKAECWQYENELRYEIELDSAANNGVSRPFSTGDLKHVIFGLHCNDRDKATITNLLANPDWKHVRLWQSEKDPVNLRIDAVAI